MGAVEFSPEVDPADHGQIKVIVAVGCLGHEVIFHGQQLDKGLVSFHFDAKGANMISSSYDFFCQFWSGYIFDIVGVVEYHAFDQVVVDGDESGVKGGSQISGDDFDCLWFFGEFGGVGLCEGDVFRQF